MSERYIEKIEMENAELKAEVERLTARVEFLTERLQTIGNLASRPVIVEMVRDSVGLKD